MRALLVLALLACEALWPSAVIVVLLACQTPAILAPTDNPKACRLTEVACVGADYRPTGYCCLEGDACGGPFPNVGCPDGECCDARQGGFAKRENRKQRRAGAD